MKRVIKATNESDRSLDIVSNLDITPIINAVNTKLGTNIEFNKEIKYDRKGNAYLDITSQSILDLCGLFKFVLQDATIATFNSSVITYLNDTRDYRLTLKIRYKTLDGGTNDISLLTAYHFIDDSSWDITFNID